MEPAPGERDDFTRLGGRPSPIEPQWSPLLVSGMTTWLTRLGQVTGLGAAMEPAPGERDDAVDILVTAGLG